MTHRPIAPITINDFEPGGMRRARVNPKVKPRDIPTTKYDDSGKLTLMASAGGYVMCRRPGCYPGIRTEIQWRAMSDTRAAYAAEGRDDD